MANLIIKSSADNLVLQGSDASPAITVGATGTTTFAENATLSGTANNVGTVTAGSIAGGAITSATTFPVGHILQTVQDVHKSEAHTTSGNFNTPMGSDLEVQITPSSSSNYILVSTSWEAEFSATGTHGCADFYRSIAGGATVQFIISNSLTGEGFGQNRVSSASGRYIVSYSYLDSPNVNGVVVSYRPSLRNSGSGNFYIGSGANGGSTIIAQEIKG